MKKWLLFIWLCSCFLLMNCSSKKPTFDYSIGIDPTFYPLQFGAQEKNVYAFSSELLQDISAMNKIKVATITMSWDNLIWGLKKGEYDAIFSPLPPYLFLEKQYSFSEPFLLTGPVLVVPVDSKKVTVESMGGKEVAVQEGSSAAMILQKYPDILIRSYDSVPKAFDDILNGTIDAAVVDYLVAYSYCNDLYQGKLKIVGQPLNDEGLRLVTLYGKADGLVTLFNEGLARLKGSSKYGTLAKKWGLPPK